MNRSDYSCDLDNWDLIRYRGAVASAVRGRRGQKLLREMADALDAMGPKRLISGDLLRDGEVCALGAVMQARQIQADVIDPYDFETVAEKLDVADALVREVAFVNDEAWQTYDRRETPEQRWIKVREWVRQQLKR
jgi:hypothetical protein